MIPKIAQIIIWNKKAFVPSKARYENGISTSIEPIYIVHPELTELLLVVREILSKEPPLLPDPTRAEIKSQQELLPRITGARSWKRLCQNGISYIIDPSEKGFFLEMSRLDKKGRWEFDQNKRRIYPAGTDLKVIIQAILDDLATRPQMKDVHIG